MIQVTGQQRPVNTCHIRNTEYYMYIKYTWKTPITLNYLVSLPCFQDWNQLCMYLGHPSLGENEMDFIYGGKESSMNGMVENVKNYFHSLIDQEIIEKYNYEIELNDTYSLPTGD